MSPSRHFHENMWLRLREIQRPMEQECAIGLEMSVNSHAAVAQSACVDVLVARGRKAFCQRYELVEVAQFRGWGSRTFCVKTSGFSAAARH